MKCLKVLTGIITIMISILIWSSCDNDCPTCPGPPGEHIFYVIGTAGGGLSTVKVFSVEQSKFIDSFTIDIDVGFAAVIGDNQKLIVGGRGCRIIDLRSKEVIYSTEEYGEVIQVSRNSKYYSICKLTSPTGIVIRRTQDNLPVHFDSLSNGWGVFGFDSQHFIDADDDGQIIIYNIENDSIESSFNLALNGISIFVTRVWPTADMKKIFFVAAQYGRLFLGAVNLGDDSVRVLLPGLNTGGVDAALSPDGKYLFFCNKAYLDYEPHYWKISVFDVQSEQKLTDISTFDYNAFDGNQMALTSDGKYLMAVSDLFGSIRPLLVNAKSFAVVGDYFFLDQVPPLVVCTKK